MLEVQALRKSYGRSQGITDVSMQVSKGTLHGFLGLNGSGKTTTMKCIMGLLRRDSGTIRFQEMDYDPSNIELRSKIGFSPELPSYPPYLTGEEVMQVYSRMRGIEKHDSERETKRLLSSVGLDGSVDKRVGKYSRGMQAKLGVAVAMIGNPDLLILDEPTAGMDPAAASSMRTIMNDFRKDGATILLSSHLLYEVQNICQNISIIDHGRSIFEGSVKDILKKGSKVLVYKAEFGTVDDALISDLKKMNEVKDCQILEGEKNMVRIELTVNSDLREDIAKVAIQHKTVMLSCNVEQESLENLFLSLVGKGSRVE